MRGQTTDSVKRRWASMYNMSRASDWAIQWTGVPFMHAGIANYDLLDSDPERPITFGSKEKYICEECGHSVDGSFGDRRAELYLHTSAKGDYMVKVCDSCYDYHNRQ